MNEREKIVEYLRLRAKMARRKANIALISIFIILFSGFSLFYFAQNIVIEQSRPITKSSSALPLERPNENTPN